MSSVPILRVVFLGTGSAGNATVITDGHSTLLVDCGFSAREVSRRLVASDIDPASIEAILVTHEHSDHVRGIDVFCSRHAPNCIVYASPGTLRSPELRAARVACRALQPGAVHDVGSMNVVAFPTSHDAAQPVGYRISSGTDSMGVATDTGVLTDQAAEALQGVRVLGIESNHDLRMLEHGPYPAFLKHRIRSARGHLSNADAANALERLASDQLEQVIALHRSATNNTAQLAEKELATRVRQVGLRAHVRVARQDAPCDCSLG